MNHHTRFRKLAIGSSLFLFLAFLIGGGWLVFHASNPADPFTPVTLAKFSENGVEVILRLERDAQGHDFVAATFTALDPGFHLYSKDVPREGIKGLGRPTLLELSTGSKMQCAGSLQESTAPLAEPIEKDMPGLLIYPEGPVTLALSVRLPDESGEIADEVAVTYMACSQKGCKKPVEGKIIPIRYQTKSDD